MSWQWWCCWDSSFPPMDKGFLLRLHSNSLPIMCTHTLIDNWRQNGGSIWEEPTCSTEELWTKETNSCFSQSTETSSVLSWVSPNGPMDNQEPESPLLSDSETVTKRDQKPCTVQSSLIQSALTSNLETESSLLTPTSKENFRSTERLLERKPQEPPSPSNQTPMPRANWLLSAFIWTAGSDRITGNTWEMPKTFTDQAELLTKDSTVPTTMSTSSEPFSFWQALMLRLERITLLIPSLDLGMDLKRKAKPNTTRSVLNQSFFSSIYSETDKFLLLNLFFTIFLLFLIDLALLRFYFFEIRNYWKSEEFRVTLWDSQAFSS